MGGHRPAALTPSAMRTAELMEARSNFRTTFEESLGWFNSVKLEEGVYFQAPDNIAQTDSLYQKFKSVLKEIVDSESELAVQVKSGKKELEVLEDHQKVKDLLGPPPQILKVEEIAESTS
ncbi:8236_t:CDS:2 [Funneliformis geosporum]|uniref:575_t:CDS:1 n=1 Tax=Funneliformis geosporum TaxID=1117311 RepID=A0A9W4T0T4_9GLOM|nr:575_t:CDS:2 [Funneliformis geosporum]CAI2188527.1 8236_t:CDS:2 [Funneliformis geosporum]